MKPEDYLRQSGRGGWLLPWGLPKFHAWVKAAAHIFVPRWTISGKYNIPRKGPVIFAPNHISDVDAPLVGLAVRWPLWYMAKRELWGYKPVVPLMNFFQAFPVDPDSPDRAALRFAEEVLGRGAGLVMFPEGKISKSGELGTILPGAVQLALRSRATVVPVGIYGSQNVIPYGTVLPRPTLHRVHVHIGKPLDLQDLYEMQGKAARMLASERLETGILEATAVAKARCEARQKR